MWRSAELDETPTSRRRVVAGPVVRYHQRCARAGAIPRGPGTGGAGAGDCTRAARGRRRRAASSGGGGDGGGGGSAEPGQSRYTTRHDGARATRGPYGTLQPGSRRHAGAGRVIACGTPREQRARIAAPAKHHRLAGWRVAVKTGGVLYVTCSAPPGFSTRAQGRLHPSRSCQRTKQCSVVAARDAPKTENKGSAPERAHPLAILKNPHTYSEARQKPSAP